MAPNLLRRIPSSLKLLLNAKSAPEKQNATFTTLPEELLLETAQHLPSVDLLSLVLTNTRFLRIFLPTLYADVDLRSSAQCENTLTFLLANTHMCGCIKSLVVRPNNEEWIHTQSSMREIESWVVVTIKQLAPHLANLSRFVWDGKELPKYDVVWKSLRECCDLRQVGVVIGLGDFTFQSRKVMPVKSSLFGFENLTAFTLRVKQMVPSSLHPPFDELPQELWSMLYRCTNLQQLTIDTDNERYIDVRPLFEGQWPCLRELVIGDFVLLDSFGTVEGTNNGLAMANFLARHPSLERLTLHQLEGWYFPLSIKLPATALPNLRHFSARHILLRHLHNVQHLESLELTNQPLGKLPLVGALWAVSQLPLTSLRIWIDCSDSEETDVKSDHAKIFADIFQSASRLLHLDVACSSDPTFSMVCSELTPALSTRHRLRSLVLTQVKKSLRDGESLKDALMLFRQSTTLELVQLQDATARWRHPRDLRFARKSTFQVVSVQPTQLAVHEIGFNKRGQRASRTFRHVLKTRRVRGLLSPFMSSANPTPSSEISVYFDAPIVHMSSKTPEPVLVESPTADVPAAAAPTVSPDPAADTKTSPTSSTLSPVPETEAERAEATDTVAPEGPSPTPSSLSQKAQHARAASVGRAGSIANRSIFTNADGHTVAGSTFINGAGTTGPHATAEHDPSLHVRAATAESALSDEQKATIAKRESKSNKQLAKIIRSEAKVEKKALSAAVNELAQLQKIQKTAAKREEKAQAAYNKSLSTFQKHEAAFLAARAKFESSQALLNSNTETLEISRNNAKDATANLQDKSTEVDGLRQMYDVDEKEREVKLVELTGKGSTRKRWSMMGVMKLSSAMKTTSNLQIHSCELQRYSEAVYDMSIWMRRLPERQSRLSRLASYTPGKHWVFTKDEEYNADDGPVLKVIVMTMIFAMKGIL
ncbi:DNA binding protein Ncp1 [Mycena chlorophos]|uniref:DNA binding protein Ncp1 n=1 Tax=Mycena chlorophos TaxID=658473 RepID=A0A8H6WGF3_MYCCL|nr:DNA binding protein Ncp1 [Mycena chlorophos]